MNDLMNIISKIDEILYHNISDKAFKNVSVCEEYVISILSNNVGYPYKLEVVELPQKIINVYFTLLIPNEPEFFNVYHATKETL